MDSEWVDACVDGSDLRVGDVVKFDVIGDRSAPRPVIQVTRDTVITAGPREWMRDRGARITRWQYHAPTRAKLEAADRERASAVQPAPPADSEPGWDHVPAEYYARGACYSLSHGDRWRLGAEGVWCVVCGNYPNVRGISDCWIRRAAHPERVRWLEEQKRTVNTDSAIVAAVDSESTYARAPNERAFPRAVISRDDAREAVQSATVSVLVDPFAAARAEAKRMLDAGANPRVVLGALDDCVLARLPGMFAAALIGHTAHSVAGIARECERSVRAPCYHGNRAGTCGWCALSRDRSDARAVASHEPAWDTADCEGE